MKPPFARGENSVTDQHEQADSRPQQLADTDAGGIEGIHSRFLNDLTGRAVKEEVEKEAVSPAAQAFASDGPQEKENQEIQQGFIEKRSHVPGRTVR